MCLGISTAQFWCYGSSKLSKWAILHNSHFLLPRAPNHFFYGPDGSGWVHMKGNGPLSVSEVQERPDMVKYAHSTVSERPTLKGG